MTDENSAGERLGMRFWGTRGSISVSGPEVGQFGGQTTCLEILGGSNRVIVDAGTGIVPLGASIEARAGDHFDLFLTHLHHDHVIGLFLFAPLFVPGVSMDIYCGNLDGESAEKALATLFSPPLFPLTFADVPARLRFIGFRAGDTLTAGGFSIQTIALNHPGGATGYRFDRDGEGLVVLTDHEHEGAADVPDTGLVEFCRGARLIAYDATYDPAEYVKYRGWGHSTWEAGAALALAAGVPVLACLHHAPDYDDRKLGGLERNLKTVLPEGFFARDGASFIV